MPVTLIDLFYPFIPKETGDVVKEVLSTRWIGQAHRVDMFEKMFSQKFNKPYCVSLNSGTSALETAYDIIDIKEGDEVITTAFTCTATNTPLLQRKAKLVFADIDPETMCVDRESIISKITGKTKAIVQVNVGGIECDELPDGLNIPIVTDACQSMGLFGKHFTCNSFQAIKHITTGDGGMITLPDEKTYRKAKLMRWFGIDREKKIENNWQCYKERQMTFDIEIQGYKRHMNDIAAAMGIVGMQYYDKVLHHRQTLFNKYKELLKGVSGIKILDAKDGKKNVYWLCTVLVENRDRFAEMLFSYGVDNNLVHLRNDIYNIFGGTRLDLPNLNEIEKKYICLPLHTNMGTEQVEYICDKIKKGW